MRKAGLGNIGITLGFRYPPGVLPPPLGPEPEPVKRRVEEGDDRTSSLPGLSRITVRPELPLTFEFDLDLASPVVVVVAVVVANAVMGSDGVVHWSPVKFGASVVCCKMLER